MTTADVPTLATSGLIDNPTNPFTGNAINANAKYDRPFYAFMSYDWDTSKNNGNQFFPGTWYRVDNQNARDKRNWVMVGENTVLPGRPALTPPRPCGAWDWNSDIKPFLVAAAVAPRTGCAD